MSGYKDGHYKSARRAEALKASAGQAAAAALLWFLSPPAWRLRDGAAAVAAAGILLWLSTHFATDDWWPHAGFTGKAEDAPKGPWRWEPAPEAPRPVYLCYQAGSLASLLALAALGILFLSSVLHFVLAAFHSFGGRLTGS